MSEKKILFDCGYVTTGANTQCKSYEKKLVENEYMTGITVDSLSGWIDVEPGSGDAYYYLIVYKTMRGTGAPGGTGVFDGMTLAQLQEWLS